MNSSGIRGGRMRVGLWNFLLPLLLAGLACKGEVSGGEGAGGKGPEVQNPVVAGSFYPANPKELEKMVKRFLKGAKVERLPAHPSGFMVPHAGYIYSGSVAAYAYKAMEKREVKRIVVMAPSHFIPGNIVSALDKDIYRTPVGDLKIDREMVKRLIEESPLFDYVPAFYSREHSLEVQLPFLKEVLPDIPIVPLVLGNNRPDFCLKVAEVLKKVAGISSIIYIASSDMSHYFPYDTAKRMDNYTITLIQKFDTGKLYEEMRNERAQLCGGGPVLTLMNLVNLSGGGEAVVLDLRNSGDTQGGKERVVGYGSVAFILKKGAKDMKEDKKEYLTLEDKKELLRIARNTLEAHIRGGKIPDSTTGSEVLKRDGAAFVTLEKGGHLRGCIGQLRATQPLYLCVREMAVSASTRDPRFPPVTTDELEDIEVEISVLTPMKPVEDISEIEVGRHGLYITKGFYSGVLLPQVAIDHGWTRDEFLTHTCMKAGLPGDCWKKGANIYSFEAVIFSEGEMKGEG